MEAEGITIQHIANLKGQLRERMSAYQELDDYIAIGVDRMARIADVKTLQNLAARLTQLAEEAISSENSAQCSSVGLGLVGRVGRLIVKDVLSEVSKAVWQPEVFDRMSTTRRLRRQNTFGTIMVCVGKGGLPGDIHIVSISGLARTNNRPESEIKREIWMRGERLFSPGIFSSIITTAIEEIAEGKLHLPISPNQLPVPLQIAQKIGVKLLPSVHAVPLLPSPSSHIGGTLPLGPVGRDD